MVNSSDPKCGGRRIQGYSKQSRPDNPLVSIITAVYNGEQFLGQTVASIVEQTYPNFEYIVIDGGSTDGTVGILQRFDHQIDYWVSEKDNGISDAFNKGICLAQGDYIMFQGDGDGFIAPDSLAQLMVGIDPTHEQIVCGRIQRTSLQGEILYTSRPWKKFSKYSLLFRMSLPHQGLLTHRSLFERYGVFDDKLRFSMDYEHLLRAYKEFPKVVLKNTVVARWRCDGVGNNRTLDVLGEYDQIKRKNHVAPNLILTLIHRWTLLKYQIKTMLGHHD